MVSAQDRCRNYRRRILAISQQVKAAHVAPAFSCVEIVDAIYNELMRPQDIFIMSKGHGCLAQYVILEEKGLLTKADLKDYCTPHGRLGAHPDYNPSLGIHASTGSLGHGLGLAVGVAYAEQHVKGSDVRVFCLLSDGECQEGSVWEAVMTAANLKLTNLTCFIDNNNYTGMDRVSKVHPASAPAPSKFKAFNWRSVFVEGNRPAALKSIAWALTVADAPTAFVCDTAKGWPVSFMMNNPIWHYRSPNEQEYEQALREIEAS